MNGTACLIAPDSKTVALLGAPFRKDLLKTVDGWNQFACFFHVPPGWVNHPEPQPPGLPGKLVLLGPNLEQVIQLKEIAVTHTDH